MSLEVWRFPLEQGTLHCIPMPRGARVVRVGVARGIPSCWAIVDPSAPLDSRVFRVVATGEPLDTQTSYLGTFEMPAGYFWHLFE